MVPVIKVIIPAFNEENSVGKVLKDIPSHLVDEIIVVNNASTDRTEVEASKAGATVLNEPIPGYGRACLKGMEYLASFPDEVDIVVFLDADYSDHPQEMEMLVEPILQGVADLVIGSRALGKLEKGNWLATRLLRLLYGAKFTDLGPFRAIKYSSLKQIDMQDKTYGWTVEMQLKAVKYGLKCLEVPVNYRKRLGFSKISGTVKGTLMAGYKIIWTIFKYL